MHFFTQCQVARSFPHCLFMSPFDAYLAAKQHRITQDSRLGVARREYAARQREAKRQWPYHYQEAQRDTHCAPALLAVRRALEQAELAKNATLAAADAVEDKSLLANEYI